MRADIQSVSSAVCRSTRRAVLASCCFLFLWLAGEVLAQAATTGTITGHVRNKVTGYALDGAFVRVAGTNVSALTQRDGSYTLEVPAGSQTVEVSYTGLDDLRATVTVAAGGSSTKDFDMTSTVYQMEAFSVKGVREGNAAALQRQRVAVNPKTVTAADAYGVPAANPGELIQRLSGISVDIVGSEVRTLYLRGMNPDFIAFQVDGNQMASAFGTSASRQFQIEQMGTGNIESVEVIKANSPDRDANAVAGFVNLVTRRAFDVSGEYAAITTGVMWRDRESSANPYQDKVNNLDVFGVRYSNSFSVAGGDHNLGLAFNFNNRRSSTTQDETGAFNNAGGIGALNTADIKNTLYRYWGTGDFFYPAIATNVGLNLDYKLSGKSYVYLRTAANRNYQMQRFYRWEIQAGNSLANFAPGSNSTQQTVLPVASSFAASYSALFTKKSYNYSINPGASLSLFGDTAKLDVDLSHSFAKIWYPGYHLAQSRTTTPIGWAMDFSNGDQRRPVLTQTAGPSWSDPASYTIFNDGLTAWKNPDTLDQLKVDFTKDLDSAYPSYVKVGIKYAIDDRAQDTNSRTYSVWSGPAGIGPYLEANYRQTGGRYGPFPFISPPNLGGSTDILTSGLLTSSNLDLYNSSVGSRASDAKLKETIAAAYAMANIKIDQLTISGGLRVEQTRTEGIGWINNADPALNYNAALSLDQNLANAAAKFAGGKFVKKGTSTDLFPSVQATYQLSPGLLLRASGTKSISRPPVVNLLPITSANPTTLTLTQGNPALRPYTSNNLDLSLEKYFEPVGLFSVAYFHKNITNYIVSLGVPVGSGTDNGFGGQYAGYTYTKPQNIGGATIQGWELNYQQQFSFLPGIWRGLGVQSNYTYLKALGNYGAAIPGGGVGPLISLVPRQANVSVFYNANGLDIRLMANMRGQFPINLNGTMDQAFWTFRDYRTVYDLKARYSFGRRYEVFLNVDNLTDVPTQTFRVGGRELYTLWQGTGFTLGFNYRL